MQEKKTLYKSTTNKKLAGVCGGVAEYFNIDATIVRLVWFLVTWFYGVGLIAYIACALILPEGPKKETVSVSSQQIKEPKITESEVTDVVDVDVETEKEPEIIADTDTEVKAEEAQVSVNDQKEEITE